MFLFLCFNSLLLKIILYIFLDNFIATKNKYLNNGRIYNQHKLLNNPFLSFEVLGWSTQVFYFSFHYKYKKRKRVYINTLMFL